MENANERDKKGFIYKEKVYRTQYAWDKQARFMLAEGKALMILTKMIKEYETITRTETLISFEERRIRLSELKHEMVTSVNDVAELDEVEPLSLDLSTYNIDKSRLTSSRLRKRLDRSNLCRRERPISFVMMKRDISMRY